MKKLDRQGSLRGFLHRLACQGRHLSRGDEASKVTVMVIQSLN